MNEAELIERLVRLERDNRRFKSAGLAVLVFAVALRAVYATRPIPAVVKAHAFEAIDISGNVGGEMAVGAGGRGWLTSTTRGALHAR